MESNLFLPSESSHEPEKTGKEDTSAEKDTKKRKKKTTTVAKKVAGNLVSVESTDHKADSKPETTEAAGEKKQTRIKKAGTAPEADTAVATEEAAETAEEDKDTAEITDAEIAEPAHDEATEEPEPIIFDRSQAPEGPLETEAVLYTESASEPSEGTEQAPEVKISPEGLPIDPISAESAPTAAQVEIGTESTPGTNQPIAANEAVAARVLYEDISAPPDPPMPERLRMLDPNLRLGETPPERHAKSLDTVVPRQEFDEAVYRAEKHGVRRGVLAGGLAGWWVGRRGKKAAVAEAGKQIEKRDTEIKKLKKDQVLVEERLRQVESAKQQVPEKDLNNYYKPDIQPSMPAKVEAPVAAVAQKFETVPFAVSPESLRAATKTAEIKKSEVKSELPPEEKPITEETYQAPEGRRLEMSSWHSIEIDEKTGKAVEDPTRAYGEEFKHEQQQEKLHHDAAVAGTATQLGQTILNAPASTSAASQQSQQSVTTDKPTAKKPLVRIKPEDIAFAKQQFKRRTLDPVTWVIALILVVLLFLVF